MSMLENVSGCKDGTWRLDIDYGLRTTSNGSLLLQYEKPMRHFFSVSNDYLAVELPLGLVKAILDDGEKLRRFIERNSESESN